MAEGRALVGALQGAAMSLAEKKFKYPTGSACVMQGAELFDQQFAGAQFQLEIERALHEDLDGFLGGHGILRPWEWLFASSAMSFAYLIGGFAGKLDSGKRKGGKVRGEGKAVLALEAFLLVDTIGKIQHNMI